MLKIAFDQDSSPMNTFTPRGLKLRLPPNIVFGLISRLFPRADAFEVLRLTESVDIMPGVATLISAAVAYFLNWPALHVALLVGTTHLVFSLAHIKGLFFFPFSIALAVTRLVAPISGWGLLSGLALGFGWYKSGWQVVAAFFVARLASGAVMWFLELSAAKRVHRETGVALTASERSFFHAFRLTADSLRESTSLELDEHEMDEQTWGPVFIDYVGKYPEVARRTIQ